MRVNDFDNMSPIFGYSSYNESRRGISSSLQRPLIQWISHRAGKTHPLTRHSAGNAGLENSTPANSKQIQNGFIKPKRAYQASVKLRLYVYIIYMAVSMQFYVTLLNRHTFL